jgi:hypothetical protein
MEIKMGTNARRVIIPSPVGIGEVCDKKTKLIEDILAGREGIGRPLLSLSTAYWKCIPSTREKVPPWINPSSVKHWMSFGESTHFPPRGFSRALMSKASAYACQENSPMRPRTFRTLKQPSKVLSSWASPRECTFASAARKGFTIHRFMYIRRVGKPVTELIQVLRNGSGMTIATHHVSAAGQSPFCQSSSPNKAAASFLLTLMEKPI